MTVHTPSTPEQIAQHQVDYDAGLEAVSDFLEGFSLTDGDKVNILEALLAEYNKRLNRR